MKTKYKDLLISLNKKIAILEVEFNYKIPDTSWVGEAIKITEDLIIRIDIDKKLDKSQLQDKSYIDKCYSSQSQLQELNFILAGIILINKQDIRLFLKKLKIVLNAPLLMSNETSNSNEGRNTLFELKLFLRLKNANYDVSLCANHPDILLIVDRREYAIECKRIYKPETLISNAKIAIEQLQRYSLSQENRFGIVAISITRYFHSGDKYLAAKSEDAVRARINYEMTTLLEHNKKTLLGLFPAKIPVLILEFSDRGEIQKPYSFNFLDIIETADGRWSNFDQAKKDLYKLGQSAILEGEK
ncbi:hypothetical protein KKF69_05080 [Patescibacteria group bacterium]|nr:hypothetical protein [Patescibacteria group bacterium]MBU4016816.1 hypothetical protein [Patescibacteria group bacterium]